MIPKLVHYCWFGNNEMPELASKCIRSWEKYLPDYQMKLWNEDSFDVNSNLYVKEAYETKKYAFVTDYVRLYALYHYGGIYMDTDVEVLKPFDDLLYLPAFSGYEGDRYSSFPTGIMASAKHGVWVSEQLAYYKDARFINPDGSLNMTTNTQTISRIMMENGFDLNGEYQVYKGDMHAFPRDFFCPKSSTGLLKITKNTYCIHHFASSWVTPTLLSAFKRFVIKHFIGYRGADSIIKLKRKMFSK
jgi:hypothetical protein